MKTYRSFGSPALAILPILLAACAGDVPLDRPVPEAYEAISMLGDTLRSDGPSADARGRLEANLDAARAAYEAAPDDVDAIIWLGRRIAYMGRFQEAIEVFTEGIARHPEDARLHRHRGHRRITVRDLDGAIADLESAAALVKGKPDEIEPDGAPNRFDIPTSTLQSNIWYHLGLAHYLKGDFDRALEAFLECLDVSKNDDMLVATSDWLYMSYRRLGREAEAARVLEAIHPDMTILENDAYHRRLLMYKGTIAPEELLPTEGGDPLQMATQGYGVANWYLYNGDRDRARELFDRIMAIGNWQAFGTIAAEAELFRMRGSETNPGR